MKPCITAHLIFVDETQGVRYNPDSLISRTKMMNEIPGGIFADYFPKIMLLSRVVCDREMIANFAIRIYRRKSTLFKQITIAAACKALFTRLKSVIMER